MAAIYLIKLFAYDLSCLGEMEAKMKQHSYYVHVIRNRNYNK